MQQTARKFEDKPAVRSAGNLLVGFVGPSGSGKTFSALRVATGIQAVVGGDIYVIDTEAGRALHYADDFKFRHVPFEAPFGPLDYLAAVDHCVARGGKTIVVDSGSHEHEGPGGVLEMHEAEVQRMGGGDKNNFRAWAKPKAERRRFINTILQMPVNFLFCFRAKEKLKVQQGKQPLNLGWMPIAGEEFIYEFALNMLLYPNSGGVPSWQPAELGEKAIIKLPQQFKPLFAQPAPLSEEIGRKLAEWARGSQSDPLKDAGKVAAQHGTQALADWWKTLSKKDQARLAGLKDNELKPIAQKADRQATTHADEYPVDEEGMPTGDPSEWRQPAEGQAAR